MLVHHRAAAGACVAGAIALALLGAHSVSQTPAAGAALSWAPLQTGGAQRSPATASGALSIPQASPGAPASAGALGGLRLPLSAMFTQLNQETRNTAVGQYSILQEIGDAIRDQIVRFLNWISGGR